MLLYDRIRIAANDQKFIDTAPKELVELIEMMGESNIILASNVARYYFSMSEQVTWSLEKDFPNVAPPFENMFIEWKHPLIINRNGAIERYPISIECLVGCHMVSVDLLNISENHKWALVSPFGLRADDWRWIIFFTLHQWTREIGYFAYKYRFSLLIDPVGRIHKNAGVQLIGSRVAQRDELQKALDFMFSAVHPALLSISFMHCKNVELKTQVPLIPISRKHEKKYGIPLVKYKILEIEPMKKILRTEGQSETLGLKHALHICRGHFKDYSKGDGLFGKYKGLYWWEPHIRGDQSLGVIVKDYNVNAPVHDGTT